MKFKEVEFKYPAEKMPLSDFEKFCANKDCKEAVIVSGYDHFYHKPGDPNSFCRYREGPDMKQLTFKRKTTDANNYVRTEHNINVVPGTTSTQIKALLSEFGYEFNVSIFKSCFVYKYKDYTLVYYICYNLDMAELGRFIEIEIGEEIEQGADEALSQLVILEKLCKGIGAVPSKRIKSSLFELFRKREASK